MLWLRLRILIFSCAGQRVGGYSGRVVVFTHVGVRVSVKVLWPQGRIVVVEVGWQAHRVVMEGVSVDVDIVVVRSFALATAQARSPGGQRRSQMYRRLPQCRPRVPDRDADQVYRAPIFAELF